MGEKKRTYRPPFQGKKLITEGNLVVDRQGDADTIEVGGNSLPSLLANQLSIVAHRGRRTNLGNCRIWVERLGR